MYVCTVASIPKGSCLLKGPYRGVAAPKLIWKLGWLWDLLLVGDHNMVLPVNLAVSPFACLLFILSLKLQVARTIFCDVILLVLISTFVCFHRLNTNNWLLSVGLSVLPCSSCVSTTYFWEMPTVIFHCLKQNMSKFSEWICWFSGIWTFYVCPAMHLWTVLCSSDYIMCW